MSYYDKTSAQLHHIAFIQWKTFIWAINFWSTTRSIAWKEKQLNFHISVYLYNKRKTQNIIASYQSFQKWINFI